MVIKRPRGTLDFLPEETEKLQRIEKEIRDLCLYYNYGEIRTPTFEHTELFVRGVGETTDIVEKEMYTFTDRGNRSVTLRPEGTAPVVRAFVENKLYSNMQPTKLFYIGPMYRYDRPQAGRYRQFHQFGVEVLGADDAAVDVEVISLAVKLFERLGLKNLSLYINSVGCLDCRPAYKEELKNYLKENLQSFCATCRERSKQNPLRVFDCKNSECKKAISQAPRVISYLCNKCLNHFNEVCEMLELLEIKYLVDEMLVRGLDYYTSTTFEILAENLGAQSAICGGGRYDKLVEECGGPDTPGIGFAVGIERLLYVLSSNYEHLESSPQQKFFIVNVGEEAKKEAAKLVNKLRDNNLSADMDHMNRSVKAQFKFANRINSSHVIILGEDELASGSVTIKDMKTGREDKVEINNIINYCNNIYT